MVKHRRIATWASSPRGARPGQDGQLLVGITGGAVNCFPNKIPAAPRYERATSQRMLLLQVFEVSFDEATHYWYDVLSKRHCVKGRLCSLRWSSTWFEFRGELTRLVDVLS
ncbi:hypothetical protein B296_00004581 [Ensete ventricosum]|uniref:Uncharacterized protein n=1 Tax=Ensete ventricosum TaxID=4639 RepID=A0A427AIL6_ENSVE|nr:hypothetical protein B296_00004581 [Ensete ventricosum]